MYDTCAEVIQAEEEKEEAGIPLWKKAVAVVVILLVGVAAYRRYGRRS